MDPVRPARGRPVDPAKRIAIAEAARELFLERGYEGVTMEGVAAAAGVSKVTVYRLFEDRPGLLATVVERESERMEAALAALPSGGDDWLVAFAMQLLAHLAQPAVQAFDRRIAAEAEAHPELVRAFFEAGPGRIRDALAERLIAQGTPRSEARELAEELMAAWAGAVPMEVRFGVGGPVRPGTVERRLRRIVARFGL